MTAALLGAIADRLKASVAAHDPAAIHALIAGHYRTIRLLHGERWVAPELAAIADHLLPALGPAEVHAFIDRVAACAARNAPLMRMLAEVGPRHAPRLLAAVGDNGDAVLPSAIALVILQDRLTAAMRGNWHVLAACDRVWRAARMTERFASVLNVFERVKVATIERVIGVYLGIARTGAVPASRGRWSPSINLTEACLEDIRLGNVDNAVCGWTLACHRAGSAHHQSATNAGPTRWADDRGSILHFPPLPAQWSALFCSWNAAFAAHFGNFPFVLAMLVNPQTAGDGRDPAEFLHNRALSLYTQVWHEQFDRVDRAAANRPMLAWADPALVTFWGRHNRAAARDYAARVAALDRNVLRAVALRLAS